MNLFKIKKMSENNNDNGKKEGEIKEEEKKEEDKKEGEIKEEEKKEEEKKEGEEEGEGEEKKEQEPLGDKISILHYKYDPYLSENIESPRSLKAMKELGYIMEDIVYFTFPEYINNNPTFLALPKEKQKDRYQFSELYRQAKIQKIELYREELIEKEKQGENNDEENNEQENNNENNNINGIEVGSSAINEELRQFERMKRKNEMDLINAVEYELQRQIMLKEGEAKIRRQNIKNDKFKKTVEIKHEIDKKESENREKRREEKRIEEEERLKKENLLKYEKEMRRAKLEEQREKERMRENIEKHRIEEEKRKEFQDKVQRMNDEYN